MKKSKGFTLIELLAVIVVLAIIAVIVTPVVVKTIDDAKKGAFKNSAYGLIKAAELDYSKNLLNDSKSKKVTYTYTDRVETSDQSGYKLEYKGQKPKDGTVVINEKGEVALAIHDGTYCAIKGYEESEVTISNKTLKSCKIPCPTIITDDKDNKTYKITQIGDQCWFAENLKYTGNGCLSKTWNSSETGPVDACRSNGVEIHYQWKAAMNGSTTEGAQGLCPSGWHIPTDAEWKILEGTVDSTYGVGNSVWDGTGYRGSDVGKKIKAVDGNGTDDYGFNGLLAGARYTDGSLVDVGSYVGWWSSSPSGTYAWRRSVYSSLDTVYRGTDSQANGFSVRCVRD